MSAEVQPMSFGAYCAECADGDGPHDDEFDAEEWATAHNAEYHDRDDWADTRRSDDADAHRKEN